MLKLLVRLGKLPTKQEVSDLGILLEKWLLLEKQVEAMARRKRFAWFYLMLWLQLFLGQEDMATVTLTHPHYLLVGLLQCTLHGVVFKDYLETVAGPENGKLYIY